MRSRSATSAASSFASVGAHERRRSAAPRPRRRRGRREARPGLAQLRDARDEARLVASGDARHQLDHEAVERAGAREHAPHRLAQQRRGADVEREEAAVRQALARMQHRADDERVEVGLEAAAQRLRPPRLGRGRVGEALDRLVAADRPAREVGDRLVDEAAAAAPVDQVRDGRAAGGFAGSASDPSSASRDDAPGRLSRSAGATARAARSPRGARGRRRRRARTPARAAPRCRARASPSARTTASRGRRWS